MCLLGGELYHPLRESLGNELVRVVLTEQAPVGAFDLRVRGFGRDPEDRVGLVRSRPLGDGPPWNMLAVSSGVSSPTIL